MGNEKQNAHHRVYINVMELLVTEEVDRQLKRLPERVLRYIKRSEVETFALNRLPALYASSEKGLQHQRDYASRDLKQQIENSVRQALAAVQIDPIRLSQPLHLEEEENSEATAVLQALKECLHSPDLTWKTALAKLQKLQKRRSNASQRSRTTEDRAMTSIPSQRPNPDHSQAWRPGTYGSRVSWRPRQQRPGSSGGFDDTPQP
ncbi:MAG: late competence development ComFB family protein [Cyanobacteria bacterium J06638_28]